MKAIKFLAIAAGSAMLLASCQGSKENAVSDNVKEMQKIAEQYVPEVIYETYGNLAEQAGELYEKLNEFTDNFEAGNSSANQAALDAICTTFLNARKYWELSEAFLYGAATDFSIDPHIDTWPLDREALATALSNAAQVEMLRGEDGIAYAGGKLGEELLGFHGIEFIIFRDGQNRTISALKAKEDHEDFENVDVTGLQELIYATAVAGDLRNKCYQLNVSWNADAPDEQIDIVEDCEYNTTVAGGDKSYGENLLGASEAGSTFATWQEVMSTILVSGCSNIANEVANTKMGSAHTGEDVNYIESPYSKKSFEDFKDNILSCQYSLYGSYGATSPETHSIMKFLQEKGYSSASSLKSALENAISKLDICKAKGAFVDIYTDSCVQDAMDAINDFDDELNKASAWIALQ